LSGNFDRRTVDRFYRFSCVPFELKPQSLSQIQVRERQSTIHSISDPLKKPCGRLDCQSHLGCRIRRTG
jgi:hypothetical protein